MKLIELYRFVRGTEVWTYTSGNEPVTYGGETYWKTPLGRGVTETRKELARASLEVRIDVLDPLAQDLLSGIVDQVVTLTVYSQDQETDTTTIEWKGRLSSNQPNKDRLIMKFESIFTSLRRPGLRARYQKTCRHVLYGSGCGLLKEDFATSGELVSVDGVTVEVTEAAAQPDGYYTGGMLGAANGTFGFIIAHAGAVLTLQRPLDDLSVTLGGSGWGESYGNAWGGSYATLYPGCDRRKQTCLDKFANLNNFGGFPWIPSKNPLGGSSIV